jgi:hypothetical protein
MLLSGVAVSEGGRVQPVSPVEDQTPDVLGWHGRASKRRG